VYGLPGNVSHRGKYTVEKNVDIWGIGILVAAFYKNRVYNFDHMSGFLTGLGAGAIISLLKRHNARSATPSALPDR